MSVVLARAPLRVSLGGGGTDLPSYHERGSGYVVSGAIDKYVYVVLQPAFDRRWRVKYSQTEDVDDPHKIKHPIFREVLLKHWEGDPLEIATAADVPAGTGLGSSGAFCVALLKALFHAKRMAVTPGALAEMACDIEINVLGEPVGKQDPYVAAHGGICAYTFSSHGTDVESVPVPLSALRKLREQLLMFFTGKTREASSVLADQRERTMAGDQEMLRALDGVRQSAGAMYLHLSSGNLDYFGTYMRRHWEQKRVRSPGITNEHIDRLYNLALKSGALGGKVVGAGGGGFLLVYTKDPQRTRQAMATARARELLFDFEFKGARVLDD